MIISLIDIFTFTDINILICGELSLIFTIMAFDKFPISFLDVLLYELGRATIFSMLDLKFKYYQVQIKVDDEYKTIIRMHEAHYEFMVMPFWLTNALFTFQFFMNDIFKAYFRKFVLVFFDDILVYSTYLKIHLKHLASGISGA